MTISNSIFRLVANWRSLALGTFVISAVSLYGQNGVATDPVGYIVTTAKGGTLSHPGLSFISPVLTNPVEWQGKLTAVSGATLTVANANWPANRWDSRYCLEIVSGPNAGVWTAIVSAAGNQLIVADPMDSLLTGVETVRIRRFTTLSDFLGAQNEAGLQAANEITFADIVTVYHALGNKSYWYYNGSYGDGAGWMDAAWNRSDDAIIAPGEGVVLERSSSVALPIYQIGSVKTGAQSVIIDARRNIVGGVTPVGITLIESQLHTVAGFVSGSDPTFADNIVIYTDQPRSYWYYDGSQGQSAGWMDASWVPADNVIIPAASTFIIDRNDDGALLWMVPAVID